MQVNGRGLIIRAYGRYTHREISGGILIVRLTTKFTIPGAPERDIGLHLTCSLIVIRSSSIQKFCSLKYKNDGRRPIPIKMFHFTTDPHAERGVDRLR